MRCELHMTLAGEMSIEIITASDDEYRLLSHVWDKSEHLTGGNGQSIAPNGNQRGFYIPLGRLTSHEPSKDGGK